MSMIQKIKENTIDESLNDLAHVPINIVFTQMRKDDETKNAVENNFEHMSFKKGKELCS